MRSASWWVIGGFAGACLVWGRAGGAWAPDKPESTPAGAGSSAAKDSDVLSKLTGKWKVEEEYPVTPESPKGAQGKGDVNLRALGTRHVVGEYVSKSKEMGTDVDAVAVFSHDPETNSYTHWWFDNYGSAHEFVGKYNPKSNELVFTREYKPADAKEKVTDVYTYTFKDEDTIVFKMEFGSGPSTHDLMLTATYTRKGKKPAVAEEDPTLPTTPAAKKRAFGS